MKKYRIVFKIFFLIVICSYVYAERPVGSGTTLNEKNFGDWYSTTLRFDDGFLFRALTFAENSTSLFTIGFNPNNCDLPYYELIVSLEDKLDDDLDVENIGYTQVRVDTRPIIEASIQNLSGNWGESALHFSLNFLDQTPYILRDISQGTILRMKVVLNDEIEDIYRFSLQGSGDSIRDAYNTCLSVSNALQPEDDNSYFSGEEQKSPSHNQQTYDSDIDSKFFEKGI
jgi:hypothetical protein